MSSGTTIVLVAGIVSVAFAAMMGKAVAWIAKVVGVGFAVLGTLMLLGKNGIGFHIGRS